MPGPVNSEGIVKVREGPKVAAFSREQCECGDSQGIEKSHIFRNSEGIEREFRNSEGIEPGVQE